MGVLPSINVGKSGLRSLLYEDSRSHASPIGATGYPGSGITAYWSVCHMTDVGGYVRAPMRI